MLKRLKLVPHRGRLNVLANVMGKPLEQSLVNFLENR